MRFWHLLFGTVFIFLAAQVSIGVPGSVANLGRWALLFGTAGVAGWMLFMNIGCRRYPVHARRVTTAIFVVLVIFLITVVVGFAFRISFLKWILLSTQTFLFVYAANRLLSLQEWHRLLEWTFLLLAGVLAIIFIAGLTGIKLLPTTWPVYLMGRIAVVGNPNSVGMIAIVGGVMALWAQRWPLFAHEWKQVIPVITVFIALVVLLWTGSRTSLFALAVGAGIWAWGTNRLMWGLGIGVFAAALALLGMLDARSLDFASIMVDRLQSDGFTDSRDRVWEESLRNWRHYPWFGYGYGVTEAYEGEGFLQAIGSVRDASGYFGVLESVGMVGLSMLVALYAVVAATLWRTLTMLKQPEEQPRRMLTIAGASLFFSLVVHAGGEPWLLGPGSFMHLIFWLSLGMCVAGLVARRPAPEGSPEESDEPHSSRQPHGRRYGR